MDERFHGVGYVEVEKIRGVENLDAQTLRVDVSFHGGELSLEVLRVCVVDSKGVQTIHEGDVAYVDLLLGIEAKTRTYNGSAYSSIGISIKRVLVFRALTPDERKKLD